MTAVDLKNGRGGACSSRLSPRGDFSFRQAFIMTAVGLKNGRGGACSSRLFPPGLFSINLKSTVLTNIQFRDKIKSTVLTDTRNRGFYQSYG